eukprot:TRINITY_DN40918_c0_g1_i1.p1 TRINITY_DN40918_c0_g1~~TRINITY_DN40918_c0_g1_i1.p1  ORF type:complete len:115 (+),score=28.14 TRINITY_DN40918_c0_g1_i1:120-464(+)
MAEITEIQCDELSSAIEKSQETPSTPQIGFLDSIKARLPTFERSWDFLYKSVGNVLHYTGKALWIGATTFIVIILPLALEIEKDQQMEELERQQRLQQQQQQGTGMPTNPVLKQ